MKILGIDPGSRSTGYGIIKCVGSTQTVIAYHHINTLQHASLEQRLHQIYQALCTVIETHQPDIVAIEQVFMQQNVQSALKLGQARGAALVAAAQYALPVSEYSARQVKQAVVGYGAASKEQVQHMITLLLKLPKRPQSDAADALAIAICHHNSSRLAKQLQEA